MANELGTWGVVTAPYALPERGPEFDIGQCGCVTSGSGAPDDAAGQDNDFYVDSDTETLYQKQGGSWVVVGTGGGGAANETGTGSPEGVVTAAVGTAYFDTAADSFWYKKTGSGNTGWIQLLA